MAHDVKPMHSRGALDRYQLLGEHGRGGLGMVVRARDKQLGREVAIKLLLRAATIASRLQHQVMDNPPDVATVELTADFKYIIGSNTDLTAGRARDCANSALM